MSESQQLPHDTNIPDPNVSPSSQKASSAEPDGNEIDRSQTRPANSQSSPRSSEEAKLAAFPVQAKSREMAEALAWQSDADVAELVALSEALRQQNTDLIDHVQELETLLEECHSALQSQVKRSQLTESQLAQQNNELQASQEKLTKLFRELEASHQVAQRQQILTETLTDQLQSSQERVAQLERQCASIQQRYNEQSQLLLQSETACSELQDRLQRQQRYTLQFKAALDKCLEMPGSKEIIGNIGTPVTTPTPYPTPATPVVSSDLQRFSVKPKPIQPWSAKSNSPGSDNENENREANQAVTPNSSEEEAKTDKQGELAENTFINPFFGAAEPEVIPDPALIEELAAEEEIDLKATEEVLWAELERLTREAVSPATAIANEISSGNEKEDNLILELPKPIETIAAEESERSILEAVPSESELVAAAVANQPPSWPSPVVYPQRTPKKIKSLAAIDLPTFPRIYKK